MKKFLILAGLMALTLVLSVTAAPSAAAPMQQANLLKNPGFEQPYSGDGAAQDWVRWDEVSSADKFGDCTNPYVKSPQWSGEFNSALIHSGNASQHIGNQWDTWHAGMWQNVPATPGTTYRFTFYARGRGGMDNFPAPSESGLAMNVRAGIDPSGNGGIWYDGDIVWSGSANPHDTWQQVSVEAVATGTQISVYTSANWAVAGVNQCRAHLDVWFDTAEVIAVGPPPTNTPLPLPTLPPAPLVTNTPVPPTATNTPEVTATFTAVPTETPSPTPEGGTICVNAFNDENGNGVQDPNEGYMAGVTFTIANATAIVGQAISTGTETPVCQGGLVPDRYQVKQVLPPRLDPTTIEYADLDVQVGQTYGVAFGSRIRAEVTPTAVAAVSPTPDTSSQPDSGASAGSGGGISGLAIAGIGMLVAAVVLLGAVLFALLRRQSS
ncbi:MAG: hypothetical protein IPJ94_21505 [Chloroflexi bacterium]|nr:hypothetical protein [Chloroflexota bacterium]